MNPIFFYQGQRYIRSTFGSAHAGMIYFLVIQINAKIMFP